MAANAKADRFLVRPLPFRTESLRGYLLRVAEENGYGDDISVPSLLMDGRRQFNAPDAACQRIGMLLGVNVEVIRAMTYQPLCSGKLAVCAYLGHTIRHSHLRTGHSVVCPLCLKELGAVSALWDLQAVTACVQHGCQLVTVCAGCEKPFQWGRPSVRRCSCGFLLQSLPHLQASQEVIALTAAIEEQILGDLPRGLDASLGFPRNFRVSATLNETLNLFEFMSTWEAASNQKLTRRDGSEMLARNLRTATLMARTLKGWPVGLRMALRRQHGKSSYQISDLFITEKAFWHRLGGARQAMTNTERENKTRIPSYFAVALAQYCHERRLGSGRDALLLESAMQRTRSISREQIMELLKLPLDEMSEIIRNDEARADLFVSFVRRNFCDALSLKQAKAALHCTGPQLAVLVSTGLIGALAGKLFRLSCVSSLVVRLRSLSMPLPSGLSGDGVRPLNAMGRDDRKRFHSILAAVLERRIPLLCDSRADSLSCFFVPIDEMREGWQLPYGDPAPSRFKPCS